MATGRGVSRNTTPTDAGSRRPRPVSRPDLALPDPAGPVATRARAARRRRVGHNIIWCRWRALKPCILMFGRDRKQHQQTEIVSILDRTCLALSDAIRYVGVDKKGDRRGSGRQAQAIRSFREIRSRRQALRRCRALAEQAAGWWRPMDIAYHRSRAAARNGAWRSVGHAIEGGARADRPLAKAGCEWH